MKEKRENGQVVKERGRWQRSLQVIFSLRERVSIFFQKLLCQIWKSQTKNDFFYTILVYYIGNIFFLWYFGNFFYNIPSILTKMPLVLAFPCEWYWYIIIYYYYVIDSMFLSPTHNPNPNTTKLEVLSSFKMNTILTACVESLVVSKAKHAYTFSLQKFTSHIFNLMPFTRTRSHIIYLYIHTYTSNV